jgi:ADP-ribosylglycohydrolase
VFPDDPWRAMTAAASLGGDTDTVAAMVGAVAGACCGMSALPAAAIETVLRVNGLDLDAVAARLLALR